MSYVLSYTLAFVVYINGLQGAVSTYSESSQTNSSISANDNDNDLTLFMDDSTLSEVMNVMDHVSGMQVGSMPDDIMKVMDFSTILQICCTFFTYNVFKIGFVLFCFGSESVRLLLASTTSEPRSYIKCVRDC